MHDARPDSTPPGVAADTDKPGTILSIQILRFIAALSVVLFHSHNALKDHLVGHRSDGIDHAFGVGASGVHIFFVISGFVMVYTTRRAGLTPGKFLSRRLIRIYPIYWVMAATYFATHLMLGTPYQLDSAQIAGALLLFPAASSLIIGPGWTLAFEMYFYLCFALAIFAGVRRGLVFLSIYYLLSAALGLYFGHHSSITNLASNFLLLEFAAGAWLGYAFSNGLVFAPRTAGALTLLGLLTLISGFWVPYDRVPSVISWGIPSFFVVAGALSFEPWLRTAIGRFVAKLGDSSYLLYLSHILTIDLLLASPIGSWDGSRLSAVWLSVPVAVVCTIAAAIGYEAIELPLLNILKACVLNQKSRPISRP